MHLLVREMHALDENEAATGLGQSPADVVLLSFSDSDLGAAAEAWQAMDERRPSLRLANLARLKHPMSVDAYLEEVVSQARCVVLRLLGGLEYWRYGAGEISALCRRRGVALAVVPGDGRQDAGLAALSTVSPSVLEHFDDLLAQGGVANLRQALRLAAHVGGVGAEPDHAVIEIPLCGLHDFAEPGSGPLAVIVFYRSYLLAGDLAPLQALAARLSGLAMQVRGIFVTSLKEPSSAAFVSARLAHWRPAVVLNATGFSARGAAGSPLDAADAPVLQLVLAGSAKAVWEGAQRGLSQVDLAMQVVLPELDGRIATAAISFKEPCQSFTGLEFSRAMHRTCAAGVALAAARAAAWARLAATPRAQRRVMILLSDYPGAGGQVGHAVGLDSFASAGAMLVALAAAGYRTEALADLVAALTVQAPSPLLGLDRYLELFAGLPQDVRDRVVAAWGWPTAGFELRHVTVGHVTLAVEPGRGGLPGGDEYHDADRPPCHAYVAFHLWRSHVLDIHALVHLGTHGVLEWLPGKAVALSDTCFPQALIGATPVIYPYIVNNPGEAACARRRIGAVTISHLTPPLCKAGLHDTAARVERLIEEYSEASGLDRRRAALLRRQIIRDAEEDGLLAEAGLAADATEDEALARLDAYLCDVKDLQIRDGLHVFGEAPAGRAGLLAALVSACPETAPGELARRLDACAEEERAALLAALDGRFVQPGPAGAPTRGRADVLPTGRNLSTTDPRMMPTRTALGLAELAAEELLRRHRGDHGENPRSVVIDLWGSASLRTGGEDLGLAFVLLGVRPDWDAGSGRVTGIEVLPLATLDRPRIDVTLRISGLFRDAFEMQIALFDSAVRAVAGRDEADDWNPLAGCGDIARVFGGAAGSYGAGMPAGPADKAALAVAYLAASSTAFGKDCDGSGDPGRFAARVAAADAFVHQQDHREMDLLEGATHAAHEGGFAAAAAALGAQPALYHMDVSKPQAPRAATVAEEIARVVRGRAANPVWIAGQMRHGYRGAGEIARAVEGLCAFAAMLPTRLDRQFDLLYAATLGDAKVRAFLDTANPEACRDMKDRFDHARAQGTWHTRRNDMEPS